MNAFSSEVDFFGKVVEALREKQGLYIGRELSLRRQRIAMPQAKGPGI